MLIFCLVLSACVTMPRDAVQTFVVVRHAEKLVTTDDDPPLSPIGSKRALALARVLRKRAVLAVYATQFQRTQASAAPTAQQFGLTVIRYDATQPSAEFTNMLRQRHPAGTVLVVGHSNTVPLIVAALCDCAAPALQDSDYGDRFEVRVFADGRKTMTQEKF
jgi:broad specificity phosphatase PhoE